MAEIREAHGVPSRIVYNTECAAWGSYDELSLDQLDLSFDVNAVGLLQLVQVLFPSPEEIPHDSRIVVSSSPAAYDPPPHFLGLAPSRVAQRALAELLNANLEPHGLRFSVFSIDGAIDEPKMRAAYPDRPTSFFISPEDIAREIARVLGADDFPVATGIAGASAFGRRS